MTEYFDISKWREMFYMTSVTGIRSKAFCCGQYWVDCDNQIALLEAKGIFVETFWEMRSSGLSAVYRLQQFSALCVENTHSTSFHLLTAPCPPDFGLVYLNCWSCVYNFMSSLGFSLLPSIFYSLCSVLPVSLLWFESCLSPEDSCDGDMVLKSVNARQWWGR